MFWIKTFYVRVNFIQKLFFGSLIKNNIVGNKHLVATNSMYKLYKQFVETGDQYIPKYLICS